jgi:hypothetical protein
MEQCLQIDLMLFSDVSHVKLNLQRRSSMGLMPLNLAFAGDGNKKSAEMFADVSAIHRLRISKPKKPNLSECLFFFSSTRCQFQVQSSPPEISAILELSSQEALSAIPKSVPPILSA